MSPQTLAPWAVRYRNDLTAALHDNHRRDVDLAAELNALSSAFGATGTLRVDLGALGPELPPGAPKLLLVEATRELLNNASFHAYGYPITLTERSSPTRVDIAVTNDGPGVDPVALQSLWARKQNSIHQFEAAGGSYRIESTPAADTGTAITLSWPASPPTARRKCPWRRP